jgi:hypothetical protein
MTDLRNRFLHVLLVLLALGFAGCDLNNNMADYFLDNTEVVSIKTAEGKTRYAVTADGTILIPAATALEPSTIIGLSLSNPRNFTVRQQLLGVPAGKDISARQTGPNEIEVRIGGAVEGDVCDLTLAMQSPDGLRDFPPYRLSIRCVSFETALRDFTVDGVSVPAFDPGKDAFKMNVPYDRASIALGGTALDPGALIEIYAGPDDSGTLLGQGTQTLETTQALVLGNNFFYVKVSAPSANVQSYALIVYRGANPDKSVTDFQMTFPVSAAGMIDESTHTISVTVPYGTDVTAMTATASHSGASISPDPTEARNYAGPVTYTISAVDGTTQSYTVTVNVASNTAREITAFYFDIGPKKYGVAPGTEAGSGNMSGTSISVTVPYGTDVTAMTATVSHSGASISPNPGEARNYAGPVTYTVSAADGTIQ